jgi:hypothetical protein
MNEEFVSLQEQGTWEVASLPPGSKALPCKWVFKVKRKTDGSVDRYKARLVVGGHKQRAGIDYGETYAPVGSYPVFRLMCALAAALDLDAHSLDITNAFVQAVLHEVVFMHFPEGYGGRAGNKVLRLRKSLYGLKQAPREWHATFTRVLRELQAAPCPADQSIWTHGEGESAVHQLMYVDDMFCIGKQTTNVQAAKDSVLTAFKGRDLGSAATFLGVQIDRDRSKRTLKISQPQLIGEILRRFGMEDASRRDVPMQPALDLKAAKEGEVLGGEQHYEYMEILGSLIFVAQVTRPDLSCSVSMLCQHMARPAERHLSAAKNVLRYLGSTRNYGITYGGVGAADLDGFSRGGGPHGCGGPDAWPSLVGYTDSDWASCKDTRRSRHGYVYMLAGGAISWSSKLQKSVAVSTAEAEYVGAATAAREAKGMRPIAHHLGVDTAAAVPLYCDNVAAVFMANNAALSNKTKHIDIQYHDLRLNVSDDIVELRRVPTNDNPADMFTKPLAKPKLSKFAAFIGLG